MDFHLPQLDTRTQAESGVKVTLKGLDGTDLPCGLVLLGGDSKAYRAAQRKLTRARLERTQQLRGKLADDKTLDQADAEEIEALADVTIGWWGMVDSKQKEVQFSREGVIALYTQFPIIREQADNAVVDRTRFIQPS
jgi:hypothetical protein